MQERERQTMEAFEQRQAMIRHLETGDICFSFFFCFVRRGFEGIFVFFFLRLIFGSFFFFLGGVEVDFRKAFFFFFFSAFLKVWAPGSLFGN